MKPHLVFACWRRGVTCMALPFILAACNRTDNAPDTQSQTQRKIERITATIDSARNAYRTMIDDSLRRNRDLQNLGTTIENNNAHTDTVWRRNICIRDSMVRHEMRNIAAKYPLGALMRRADIVALGEMLAEYHRPQNARAAKNIIDGRGTLADLYAVSFDLDYQRREMPFFIINDNGDIRFTDTSKNRVCVEFESLRDAIYSDAPGGIIDKKLHRNREYVHNAEQIDFFDSVCTQYDNLHESIENHFIADYAARYTQYEDSVATLYETLGNMNAGHQK